MIPPVDGRLLVDGHEDIAFNVVCGGRDCRRAARETRDADAVRRADAAPLGEAMLGLADWRQARVAVIAATIFVEPERSRFNPHPANRYRTADEAHAAARRQLEVYRALSGDDGPFRIVRSGADLDAVVEAWRRPGTPPIGLILLMENADPIRTPDEVAEWHDAGVRIVGPAWMGTRYCGGTFEPGPLTPEGRELLDRMAARGMVLDTSHMADEAFDEAVERYRGPVIASHSNPRALVPGDRHLSDAMIRALVVKDGVIGHVPYNAFLVPGWRASGARKDAATLATVVRAIDYVCDLAGSARHVAIGSDFDGGFGAESTPVGLETVADLPRIGEALADRGYRDDEVAAFTHGNWLRVLRRGLDP